MMLYFVNGTGEKPLNGLVVFICVGVMISERRNIS